MKYQFFFYICGKMFTPFHEIFVKKIPIQNVFDQNFFTCQPIFKIFASDFATNYVLNCAKKIVHLDLNNCKISAKKLLSGLRKHTLIFCVNTVWR